MKKLIVMVAPFNTRSGYGDHARSIFYSIMDRKDIDIKCIDVKWGSTPRNHLRPEVPRHKKLLDTAKFFDARLVLVHAYHNEQYLPAFKRLGWTIINSFALLEI